MDLNQATVTIPYMEFEKHQDQVKEIESARKITKKLKSGELVDKEDFDKALYLILCYQEYMNHILNTKNSTIATMTIYEFAKQKGIEVDRDNNMNYLFRNIKTK